MLVIGAELVSRLVDMDDPETALVFGDGAGALVVQAGPGQPGDLRLLEPGRCGHPCLAPAAGHDSQLSQDLFATVERHSFLVQGRRRRLHQAAFRR